MVGGGRNRALGTWRVKALACPRIDAWRGGLLLVKGKVDRPYKGHQPR